MDGLILTGWRTCVGVALQIRREERLGMFAVSVERQEKRGPLLHDPHARVGMPMDPSLMTLGVSEEALQIQIILREVHPIPSGKQARRETFHHPPHVLTERIGISHEQELDLVEFRPALFRWAVVRIEGYLDRADVLDLPANLFLLFGDRG